MRNLNKSGGVLCDGIETKAKTTGQETRAGDQSQNIRILADAEVQKHYGVEYRGSNGQGEGEKQNEEQF